MSGLIGGGNTPTNAPIKYSGLNVSTSQWNMPVPIFWGTARLTTNAISYGGFYGQTAGGKGGKGGGGKGGQQKTYFADCILALCEGPLDADPQNIWANGSTTTTTTLAKLNMAAFLGSASQTPWSFWESKYPASALAYANTAYLGAPNLALGQSATIPDNGFECVRTMGFAWTRSGTTAGWINPATHAQSNAVDVLLSDVAYDWLTNPQYGALMAVADIGSMSQWANYQRAQDLVFSPLMNSQEKATAVLNRWAQLTNSWIYWGGTQLMFVPLGDAAITGNGVTFVPQNDVAYTLQLSDLVVTNNEPPVKHTRKDPADCYNRTTVSITDRTLGYISNPIQWYDDTLINTPGIGLRDNTSISADEVKDPLVGAIIAQLAGKRAAYIRNTYIFKPTRRFIRCLPGTVLMIPLNYTGQSIRVRVTDVERDDKGQLTFTAEEFPGTVGTFIPPQATAAAYPTTFPNLNVAPASVNTPAIIEPQAKFTAGTPKIIVAASGETNWGGCDVWLSFDGTTYRNIGSITTPAVQGLLTANLAAFSGANPDTTHTLAVDCTQSGATPQPVANADAQFLRTLSLVCAQPTPAGGAYVVPSNGELLAFGDVTTTGTNTANLTYLERGQYGTAAGTHSTGDQFTLIDVLATSGTSVAFDLPAAYIGQTLYIKLASFNEFGNETQDLSACTEYQYTPTGAGYGTGSAGVPAAPTGVSATPTSYGSTTIGWSAEPATDNVSSYSVYRAAGLSASFGAATLLWSGLATTYSDTSVTTSAAYTYFVVATNAIGNSSPSTGAGVTATSGTVTTGGVGTPISLTGAVDGTNTTFTMASALPTGSIALVSVNGSYLNPTTDFAVSGTTLTFTTAPVSGATLVLSYFVIVIPGF